MSMDVLSGPGILQRDGWAPSSGNRLPLSDSSLAMELRGRKHTLPKSCCQPTRLSKPASLEHFGYQESGHLLSRLKHSTGQSCTLSTPLPLPSGVVRAGKLRNQFEVRVCSFWQFIENERVTGMPWSVYWDGIEAAKQDSFSRRSLNPTP